MDRYVRVWVCFIVCGRLTCSNCVQKIDSRLISHNLVHRFQSGGLFGIAPKARRSLYFTIQCAGTFLSRISFVDPRASWGFRPWPTWLSSKVPVVSTGRSLKLQGFGLVGYCQSRNSPLMFLHGGCFARWVFLYGGEGVI